MTEVHKPYNILGVRIGKPYFNYYGKEVTDGEVDILLGDNDGIEIFSGTPITESLIAKSLEAGAPVGPNIHKPIRLKNGVATYKVLVRPVSI